MGDRETAGRQNACMMCDTDVLIVGAGPRGALPESDALRRYLTGIWA
jgi:hypothetical protein